MSHHFLFVRSTNLESSWPFIPDRLVARLREQGDVTILNADHDQPVHEQMDLRAIDGIAFFGVSGTLTDACIAVAPRLRMVGTVSDSTGWGLPMSALDRRDIPMIDSGRAWAQSVAELGLGLALSALRRVPWWHRRMATETPEEVWQYEAGQYCDDSRFVNGTLGTKRVGIVGLGQIGRRVAHWCATLGADVAGYDPFLSGDLARNSGAALLGLDAVIDHADVLFITVPATPSAEKIVSRERINRLKRGSLVVIVTRAHAVDMDALRVRIVADELFGAFDVYDVEPVPANDSLLGRDNVIHVPHIAGRTRDANLLAADIIADDFERILRGEAPVARLTPAMIEIRMSRTDLPRV